MYFNGREKQVPFDVVKSRAANANAYVEMPSWHRPEHESRARKESNYAAPRQMLEEVPDRVVAHHNPALRQLRKQRPQGHIRLLGQAAQEPVTLASKSIGSPA